MPPAKKRRKRILCYTLQIDVTDMGWYTNTIHILYPYIFTIDEHDLPHIDFEFISVNRFFIFSQYFLNAQTHASKMIVYFIPIHTIKLQRIQKHIELIARCP